MAIKIKVFFTVLFLFQFNSLKLSGQNVAIIDFDSISFQIIETKLLLEKREQLVENFQNFISICYDQYIERVKLYTRGCPSQEQSKKMISILTYEEYKLYEIAELIDSLIFDFEMKSDKFIRENIIKNFVEYFENNNIKIDQILNTEGLLYYEENLGYTKIILGIMNKEGRIQFAKNETLHFMNPIIENISNRIKLKSKNCFGEIPEEIDTEKYRSKIESMTLINGVEKEYKYLLKK